MDKQRLRVERGFAHPDRGRARLRARSHLGRRRAPSTLPRLWCPPLVEPRAWARSQGSATSQKSLSLMGPCKPSEGPSRYQGKTCLSGIPSHWPSSEKWNFWSCSDVPLGPAGTPVIAHPTDKITLCIYNNFLWSAPLCLINSFIALKFMYHKYTIQWFLVNV